LEKAVDQVEENVFGVLRVTLDAHDVVPTSEHLDPGLIRPRNHLGSSRKFLDLVLLQTVAKHWNGSH
jgi:hypothetical protein